MSGFEPEKRPATSGGPDEKIVADDGAKLAASTDEVGTGQLILWTPGSGGRIRTYDQLINRHMRDHI